MHLQRALASAGLILAAVLAGPVASASATTPDVIYTTTDNGTKLATLDPVTGASTVVGSFGYANTYATAVSPDGTVWTIVDGYASTAKLARVDPATGVATPLATSLGTPMISLDFAGDGTAYGIGYGDEKLYRIDTTTGAATAVGPATGISQNMDLAFDCDGTLWATSMGHLYTVDTTDGTVMMQPMLNGDSNSMMVMGLMVDSNCDMLATTFASPGKLFKLDTATSTLTLVAATSLVDPHGGSIRTFVHDTAAPVTTDDVPAGLVPSAPAVTLTATDDYSGVAHTYYTTGTDPAVPTPSSTVYDPANKPVLANGEKISYFSVDARGNAETPHTSGAAHVGVAPTATAPPATVARTSNRVIVLHIRKRFNGHAVRAIAARVSAGVVTVGKHNTVTVDLRGRACGTATVRLTVTLKGGKSLKIDRDFKTCTPGS